MFVVLLFFHLKKEIIFDFFEIERTSHTRKRGEENVSEKERKLE